MLNSFFNPLQDFSAGELSFLAVLFAWTMIWKGIALWKSAGLRQKVWFIVLLVINTFGILELIYIFFVSKKYSVEVIDKEN